MIGSTFRPSTGRWPLAALLALAIVRGFGPGGAGAAPAQDGRRQVGQDGVAPRFEAIDVFVDSGEALLAAWQLEVSGDGPKVTVVGVEGGEHAAFREPPYHDTRALQRSGRLIIAAFHTRDDLPTARTRVARVHFMVEGDGVVRYTARLVVAGGANGDKVTARASVGPAKENGR